MKTTLAFLLVITGILPAAVEQDWTAWQWAAPLEVNQTGMMRLEVPPAVLAVSRPDLGDLRLLSATGVETPYLVEVPRHREGSVRDAPGIKVVLAGTNTVIEVSAEPAEAVELVSPAREFLKSVSIEGRNGSGEWQPLATNEVIFRQAAGAERLRVPLPAGTWESLRFTIHDDRTQPVPFTGVRSEVAGEKPAGVELPVVFGAREEVPGETRLTLDLGDNPPIPVENPHVRYSAPAIVAKLTDDAPLFLVYGNPKATAPQYDLRLVRNELMAAEPQPASLREEEILGPDKREKMSVTAGSPWLWLALGGVVVALLVVVAKLLPRPAVD